MRRDAAGVGGRGGGGGGGGVWWQAASVGRSVRERRRRARAGALGCDGDELGVPFVVCGDGGSDGRGD